MNDRAMRISDAIAATLRRVDGPISAADIKRQLNAHGRNDTYSRVYAALRKSPRFSKVGSRWILCRYPVVEE